MEKEKARDAKKKKSSSDDDKEDDVLRITPVMDRKGKIDIKFNKDVVVPSFA